MSADQAAVLTSQEDEACGDFTWLAWAAQGRSELILRLFVHRRWDQRRPYWTRTNAVNTNTFAYLLVGQASGKRNYSALGRCVIEKIRTADIGIDRGIVDDGIAGFQVGKSVLGEVEVWMDISVERLEPLFPV